MSKTRQFIIGNDGAHQCVTAYGTFRLRRETVAPRLYVWRLVFPKGSEQTVKSIPGAIRVIDQYIRGISGGKHAQV